MLRLSSHPGGGWVDGETIKFSFSIKHEFAVSRDKTIPFFNDSVDIQVIPRIRKTVQDTVHKLYEIGRLNRVSSLLYEFSLFGYDLNDFL